MKKIICTAVLIIMTGSLIVMPLAAWDPFNTSVEAMYQEAGSKLKHKLEPYERDIIDTTYLYYYKQCEGSWNKSHWNKALDKSVALCRDKAAIAAAKAGEFGEKFLKAVIVSSENLWDKFTNWLDRKSDEYDERH